MQPVNEWRLANSIGIPYRVVSREGEFSYEGATATEEYIIRSSDLLQMAMFGFPEPIAFGGTLLYPQQPVISGLGTLVPKRIGWKSHESGKPCDPFGADPLAPANTYSQFCNIVINYGTTPENDQEQDPDDPFTFLEVSAAGSGVFLNSPLDGKSAWELGPGAEEEECEDVEGDRVCTGESTLVKETNVPHTIVETQVQWNVRWPRIPFTFWNGILMTRMREKLGKVNDGEMALLHNAPADTVLFQSYRASTSYTWRQGKTGRAPVNLEMNFLEKNFTSAEGIDVTNQHVWRPNYGWRRLMINEQNLYADTNLNQIWSP